ncbi:MAG: hypothetical protein K9G64_08135 [Bacteroidia bacterium]|nr:hypothetical protein [Bacteroidia bacterium]
MEQQNKSMNNHQTTKGTKGVLSVLVFAMLMLGMSWKAGAASYFSIATGNWNVNTSWSLTNGGGAVGAGVFPIAGDIVTIDRDFTVTVNSTGAACLSLQLGTKNNGTGTLTFSGTSDLTVSSIITNGGTANGNTSGAGTITMVAGGTLSCASFTTGPQGGTYNLNVFKHLR